LASSHKRLRSQRGALASTELGRPFGVTGQECPDTDLVAGARQGSASEHTPGV